MLGCDLDQSDSRLLTLYNCRSVSLQSGLADMDVGYSVVSVLFSSDIYSLKIGVLLWLLLTLLYTAVSEAV
jgi:hypothetical protein